MEDYEEGTYDVAVTCGTSGTITVAGAYNQMQYTKIGRVVTASGLIVMSAISSPVGILRISLPFVNSDLGERSSDTAVALVINGSVANTAGSYVGYIVEGQQYIQIFEGDAATYGTASANQIQASSTIWFQATYTTP